MDDPPTDFPLADDPPVGEEEVLVSLYLPSDSPSFSCSPSFTPSSTPYSTPKEIWLDVDIRVLFSPPTIQMKYPSGLGGWVRKGEHNEFVREVNRELEKEWVTVRNRLLVLVMILGVCSLGALGFVLLGSGGNMCFYVYLGFMAVLGGGIVGVREYMGREVGKFVGRVGGFVEEVSSKRFQLRGVCYWLDYDLVEQHLQLESHRANFHDHQDPYTPIGRFGTKRLSLVISFAPGMPPFYQT